MLRVFVYGTLKRNEPNYHWLTNSENGLATFLCRGKLVTKLPLVIGSRYNIPFLLDAPGQGENVQGEVYEIDEKMLSHLDILEEYPKLYTRREEDVQMLDEEGNLTGDCTVLKAWVYLLPSFRPHLLNLPHLSSYSSNGPHNLPYLSSQDDLSDPEDIYT